MKLLVDQLKFMQQYLIKIDKDNETLKQMNKNIKSQLEKVLNL